MSIHEIFKDESKQNINHHIKCYSLDTNTVESKNINSEILTTQQFNTQSFFANNILAENITCDGVLSKEYTVNDDGNPMKNAYTVVQALSATTYYPDFGTTPNQNVSIKGFFSGNEAGVIKTGRTFEIKYTLAFTSSTGLTHTFRPQLGGTLLDPINITSLSSITNLIEFYLHFYIGASDPDTASIAYHMRVRNISTGATSFLRSATTIQLFYSVATFDLFYNWAGSAPPTYGERLAYNFIRIS